MGGQMELELGLGLPNQTPRLIKGLDLNRSNIVLEMENSKQKRRRFIHDQDGIEVESRSSLLLWSGGGRHPEGDGARRPKSRKLHLSGDNEENQEIEGWPPHHPHGSFTAAEQMRSSMYVKVKMEGVAIGRKIDLRRYDSYLDLMNTLIDMFAKYYTIKGKKEDYTLLYQDKEGDWMLVADVQWETFMESVHRLEIQKNDNKMGFRILSSRSSNSLLH